MARNWEADWKKTRVHLPQIKRICGEHLIGEAPVEEDRVHNTDLVVLRLDAVRICCRVRSHKWLARHGHEFTVRAGRPSGAKTELRKVVEGWGDYFFYGFDGPDGPPLAAWLLGDLKVFRGWFVTQLALRKGSCPGLRQENDDKSSWFFAFTVADLPPEFVVARECGESWQPPPPAPADLALHNAKPGTDLFSWQQGE
jgi:hypothetical protein